VTVDVTYTVNRYKVKFVDEDGETVLKAETEYDYGTLAADVEKPADPTKAATADKVYTFAGWSPAVADVTGDATYTATYSETGTAAAVITVVDNGDGTATTNTAYVATLAEAIEAAQDGDTVQLLADVSEPAVAIEDDITIDLNGNTWTVTAADGEDAPGSIVVSGDVAIVDSSEDGDGAISSAAATVLVVDAGDEAGADASVTIGEDATITATGDNATALAVVDGSATVEGAVTGDVTVAEDGDVTVGGGTVAGDIASTGGIVEVADGTVDGDVTATGDGATVAVIGGDVTGGVAVSNGADATVSAGSVADGIAATGEGSTVAVSGGTVSGGIEGDDDIAVSGGAVNGCVDAGGKLTITGGTITAAVGADEPAISAGGATEISGGTVNGDVEAVTGGDVKISGTADIEGNVEANGEGSTVGISGGTVSGTLSETNGGDITVTGGHFAEDPTTYVDTDAYQVSGNATDGYDVTERTSIEGAVISVAENLIYTGLGQPGVTNVAVDGTALVLGTDYTVAYDDNVNAGTVTATISGAGAWNGSTNVTFQIGKATLVATADDKTVDYGTDPAEIVWTVTVTGFVNNETTNDLVSVPVAACATYTDRTLPGEYAIVASGGEAANYVITYADGVLAVAATAQPVKPGDLFTAADIAAGVKPVEVTDDGKFVVRFRRAQTGVTYELVAATSLETTEAQWKGVAESGNAVVLATDTTTTEVGDLVEFEVETPAAYPVRFFKIRASFKTNEQP
ncbi:MAG: hypothetical protein IJV65_05225, partial [Kiritimatiellae bacterium]|nr:hypothetical protein [Kiritimatiellia bacterium]